LPSSILELGIYKGLSIQHFQILLFMGTKGPKFEKLIQAVPDLIEKIKDVKRKKSEESNEE